MLADWNPALGLLFIFVVLDSCVARAEFVVVLWELDLAFGLVETRLGKSASGWQTRLGEGA